MGTESLRLRLVFEDVSILTKTQRSDGMNHTWILLKSQQHRTISDVCSHLLNIFKLNRSCPNGIILAMEGFALPPFESTEILKDKEIISVKKKCGATATIEAEDGRNLLDEVEDDELEPRDKGLLLLANDNRTGEHESESEEVDEEQSHDEDSPVETVSKKRKASMKLQNSKKKKQCLGALDDSEYETEMEEIENGINKKKKQNEETNKSAATSNMKLKSPSIVKRSKELEENAEEVNQVIIAPPPKKMASRSARRKKAKRQWMKELAKIGKKKPQQYSKPEVTKPEYKEANGQPKGLLHWKQASKQPVQNGDVGPAVTRPSHIRFESFDEDQAVQLTGRSKEIVKWNGSSSKKRGQKWGRDKFSNFQSNVAKRTSKESFKVLFKDAQVPVIDLNDFDKLPPCSEPKEGDVIAYRLLELNSSWIPEFSSFRVGRISYYDAKDIVLIPVPEYPISLDNMDEDGPNDCLYEKDGTLELNYSALVDVRNLKQYVADATEPVSNAVNQTPVNADNNAAETLVSNNNDIEKIDTPKNSSPEEVNPWDQFSKVISKNIDTPEPNRSSKVGSGSDPCSSCVTVGPTVGPDTNKAESSGVKDSQKGNSNSSDPWVNATNPEPSQQTNAGWSNAKTTVPSEKSPENNYETGSSWGRPWSSFVPLKVNLAKQPTNQNDWRGGSSRGGGKQWSRGGGRGRGHNGDSGGGGRGRGRGGDNGGGGRGRGRSGGRGCSRGQNANMM